MRTSKRRPTILLVVAVTALLCSPAITQSEQRTTTASDQPNEFSAPLYTPPKNVVPRARVGGEMRGTGGSEPEVVALVPDHVGMTTNKAPALNYFLSKPTTHQIRFTISDIQSIRPFYELDLPNPPKAGIQTIDLKVLGVELDPNVQYRWYVSVVRNPDSPSQDIVAGGIIERCEFSECITAMDARVTCNKQNIIDNARAGFWYDAMGCLCNLINAEPLDTHLRRLRAALLKQVGLNGVADWDLRAIQSSLK
jgi:Domain of Unknown Function (DUF928)